MRYNTLKSCAALSCRACADETVCVAERYPALRIGFGMEHTVPPTVEKNSAVPLFRSGHMSAICARLGSKGKVGVQRGRKTAGCPSFLPPPRGAARSRRPQTANPLAEVQRKTPRPLGANTLTQFASPAQPVLKKSRPDRANTPAAVRVPRSAGAEKAAARKG